jgi:hypothetical protein
MYENCLEEREEMAKREGAYSFLCCESRDRVFSGSWHRAETRSSERMHHFLWSFWKLAVLSFWNSGSEGQFLRIPHQQTKLDMRSNGTLRRAKRSHPPWMETDSFLIPDSWSQHIIPANRLAVDILCRSRAFRAHHFIRRYNIRPKECNRSHTACKMHGYCCWHAERTLMAEYLPMAESNHPESDLFCNQLLLKFIVSIMNDLGGLCKVLTYIGSLKLWWEGSTEAYESLTFQVAAGAMDYSFLSAYGLEGYFSEAMSVPLWASKMKVVKGRYR